MTKKRVIKLSGVITVVGMILGLIFSFGDLIMDYNNYTREKTLTLTGTLEGFNNKIKFDVESTHIPVVVRSMNVFFPADFDLKEINISSLGDTLPLNALRASVQKQLLHFSQSKISDCEDECLIPVVIVTTFETGGKTQISRCMYSIYYSYTLHNDFPTKLPTVAFQKVELNKSIKVRDFSKVLEKAWREEKKNRGF